MVLTVPFIRRKTQQLIIIKCKGGVEYICGYVAWYSVCPLGTINASGIRDINWKTLELWRSLAGEGGHAALYYFVRNAYKWLKGRRGNHPLASNPGKLVNFVFCLRSDWCCSYAGTPHKYTPHSTPLTLPNWHKSLGCVCVCVRADPYFSNFEGENTVFILLTYYSENK